MDCKVSSKHWAHRLVLVVKDILDCVLCISELRVLFVTRTYKARTRTCGELVLGCSAPWTPGCQEAGGGLWGAHPVPTPREVGSSGLQELPVQPQPGVGCHAEGAGQALA